MKNFTRKFCFYLAILLCVNLAVPATATAAAKNITYTSSNIKKGKITVPTGTYNQITIKSSAQNATIDIKDSSISELKVYAENITILTDKRSTIDKVSIYANNITIAGTGLYSKINYLGNSSSANPYTLPIVYITNSPKITKFNVYADSSINGDTTSRINTLAIAKFTSAFLKVPVDTLTFSKTGYLSSVSIHDTTVNWIKLYGTMNYVSVDKKTTIKKVSITGLGNELTALGKVKQVNLFGQYSNLSGIGINSIHTSKEAINNTYIYNKLEPDTKVHIKEIEPEKYAEYTGASTSDDVRKDIAIHLAKEIISQEGFDTLSTDIEKVKAVHDYIVLNTSYEYNVFNDAVTTCYPGEAIGPLLHQKAICGGYSELFEIFMNLLDIPCESINGVANGYHSWNVVTLDGERYHIDVTWDDPERGKSDYIRYDYFLINDKQMSKDHTWSDSVEPCNGKKYLNYTGK